MNNNRTLAELKEAVIAEMQLDPGLISDTERETFINDALKELGRMTLFEKTASVDIVNGVITLPDDFSVFIELRYGNLRLKPAELKASEPTTDAPLYYCVFYDKIYLYPATESGTADLFYVYKPAMLVNDTDKPDLPNGWDSIIIDYAVARAHRKNGNTGLYREYMSAFNSGRGELAAELTVRMNSRVTNTIDNENYNLPMFSSEILL